MTLADALSRAGGEFAVVGRFAHGEVGATLVRDHAGREAVAKWFWPARPETLPSLREAGALVDRLRAAGSPVPRSVWLGAVGDGVLCIQERLPGATEEVVGEPLIDDLLAAVARQAGLGSRRVEDEDWTGYMTRSLVSGLEGYCEHGSLAGHDAGTRRLLMRVRAAGAALDGVSLPADDAVHGDLHHLNALQSAGRLTGIVDCEGMRAGDRRFDLVTLAFCLAEADCPRAAVERVWRTALAGGGSVALRAYVAHIALRQVDWSIRHRTPADVSRWLARGQAALARLGG